MKGKILMAAGGLLVAGVAIIFAATSSRGLDGTWWAVAGIKNGVAEHFEAGDFQLTIDGYKMSEVQTLGDGEYTKPKLFTVMADKKANTIDILYDDKRALGIFKLEGNTLTLCVNDEGGPRPSKFESTKGSKVSLVVLQRK